MNLSKISVRYAKALFLLAKEKNVLDEVYAHLNIMEEIIEDSPEFKSVLDNITIKRTVKKKIIRTVFADFHKVVIDFMCLLVDKDRQRFFKTIFLNYSTYYRKEKQMIHLTTTTSQKLSDSLKKKIIDFFANAYSCTIELEEKVDESIIGGIIFRMDNRELNMSVKNQLEEIKESLYSDRFKKKM